MSDWTTAGLPLPQLGDYGYKREVGILASPFDTALPRQAQGWKAKRETFSVSCHVLNTSLAAIEAFFAADAYDWFTMPLVSGGAGTLADLTVRAVAPYQLSPLGAEWWKLTCTVETKIDTDVPDMTAPGYTCVDEPCCAPDDFQCCESFEWGCVGAEWDQDITNEMIYDVVGTSAVSSAATAWLPDAGKLATFFTSALGSCMISSVDGNHWAEPVVVNIGLSTQYYRACWTVGDYCLITGYGGSDSGERVLAFTKDGVNFINAMLVGGPRFWISNALYVASKGEYWLYAYHDSSSDGKNIMAFKSTNLVDWTYYDAASITGGLNNLYSYGGDRLSVIFVEALHQFIATRTDHWSHVPWSYGEPNVFFESSNGLAWAALPALPNGWLSTEGSLRWNGSEVLLLPAESGTVADGKFVPTWCFASSDGCQTWYKKSEYPVGTSADSIVRTYGDIVDNRQIVLHGGLSMNGQTGQTFFYSSDGGATWLLDLIEWACNDPASNTSGTDARGTIANVPGSSRWVFVRRSYSGANTCKGTVWHPAISVASSPPADRINYVIDATGAEVPVNPPSGLPSTTILGYLDDGTAVYEDAPGIGTLYIPNKANPHTIVYDTYVAQTYHPGCANSDPGTNAEIIACRNDGTMEASITYVQRISSTTSSVKIDGASQAVISDNSSYKFAVTDHLILNDEFQASPIPGVSTKCQATTGKTVSLYGASSPYYALGCELTAPKYVEFTATGSSGARCGVGDFVCRATVTVQER
jgi:hypothetical protein